MRAQHDPVLRPCVSAVLDMFDYVFPENGLKAFHEGRLLAEQSFKDYIGEENLKRFLNFTLRYLADIDIPIKRCVPPPQPALLRNNRVSAFLDSLLPLLPLLPFLRLRHRSAAAPSSSSARGC